MRRQRRQIQGIGASPITSESGLVALSPIFSATASRALKRTQKKSGSIGCSSSSVAHGPSLETSPITLKPRSQSSIANASFTHEGRGLAAVRDQHRPSSPRVTGDTIVLVMTGLERPQTALGMKLNLYRIGNSTTPISNPIEKDLTSMAMPILANDITANKVEV